MNAAPSELFFQRLQDSDDRVLLLDYDGTIAPFAADRQLAVPYPTVTELLDCIMTTCETSVALVSGRAAREIPPLLGLCPHPEIWGTYGIERLRPNGEYVTAGLAREEQETLEEAGSWLDAEGLGGLVEIKPGAIAVHWRGLSPATLEEVRTSAYRVLGLFKRRNLWLSEFDGGVELRIATRSKADVVYTFLAEHGANVPIAYLGDDASDEDAFRALNGRGLTVLVRPTYRFTAAQTWILPPVELIQFLANWVKACGGDM